jgi:hypothetical protein
VATLTELTTTVVRHIGSINATDDATEITKYLNRGVLHVLSRTGCYVTSTTLSTVAGTSDYTLAASILEVAYIDYTSSGSTYAMERVTPVEIMRLRRSGSGSSSPATRYAVQGHNLLMLYPTPAAIDTINMYVVPVPTVMSSGSHDPSNATYGGIPVQYHDLIEFYACWHLAMIDDDASSQIGRDYKALLDVRINDLRRDMQDRGGHMQARFRSGRRQALVPRNPSTDLG